MMKLYAPNEYWRASQKKRDAVSNGCGSKLDLSRFIPNTMYGLCIKDACDIHDWQYKFGKTRGDKMFADATFLLNLCVIILTKSGWFLKVPRLLRATKYFVAVIAKGDKSFYHDKPRNEEMTITFHGSFRDMPKGI